MRKRQSARENDEIEIQFQSEIPRIIRICGVREFGDDNNAQ